MSGGALIAEAAAAGVTLVRIGDDRLRWTCAGPPPPDLLARIRAAKSEVLAALGTEDPQAWRDWFEERAAIREHDGGLSRDEAEAGALADLAQQWRSENPLPASDRAACYHCGQPDPCTPVLARNGHAWLHRECWDPANAARSEMALAAVRALLRRNAA